MDCGSWMFNGGIFFWFCSFFVRGLFSGLQSVELLRLSLSFSGGELVRVEISVGS